MNHDTRTLELAKVDWARIDQVPGIIEFMLGAFTRGEYECADREGWARAAQDVLDAIEKVQDCLCDFAPLYERLMALSEMCRRPSVSEPLN